MGVITHTSYTNNKHGGGKQKIFRHNVRGCAMFCGCIMERSDPQPQNMGDEAVHPSNSESIADEPHNRCCRIVTFLPSFVVFSVAFYFCGVGKQQTKTDK